MTSAIILAAGESKRFGLVKALAKLESGLTFIEHLCQLTNKAGIDQTIVVLGAHKEIAKVLQKNISVYYNPQYHLGQTSSIKIGVAGLNQKSKYFFILPVDCQIKSEQTLIKLINELENNPQGLIAIPCHQGKKGHPPLYRQEITKDILALDDTAPLFTINRKYQDKTILVEVEDSGVVSNFNYNFR